MIQNLKRVLGFLFLSSCAWAFNPTQYVQISTQTPAPSQQGGIGVSSATVSSATITNVSITTATITNAVVTNSTITNLSTNNNKIINLGNGINVTDAGAFGQIGMVLIASATTVNVGTITFSVANTGNYSQYVLFIDTVSPSVNAVNLEVQISVAGSYVTTGYVDQTFRFTTAATGNGGQSSSARSWLPSSNSETLGTGAAPHADFEIHIYGVNSSGLTRAASWTAEGQWSSGNVVSLTGTGHVVTTNGAIDGVRIFTSNSSQFVSGKFFLYGIQNSF